MGRLAKLTDLFEEGVVAPLKTSSGTEVVVWLNKLSPFEMEQSTHEGRVARARIMLAIREIGTPESDLFRLASEDAPLQTIIDALLADKDNERTVKVIHELRADKDWKERLETLEWSTEQLKGKGESDPEVQVVAKILDEYQAEIISRTEFLANQLRSELVVQPENKLREQHRDSYAQQQGISAFIREQAKSQIFYSMRICRADRDDNGRWQHEGCNHAERWLEDRTEVEQLPESLLDQVKAAYDQMNMDPDIARFLVGPASSSESHGPSSKPEDSKESGQEEISEQQVGILS